METTVALVLWLRRERRARDVTLESLAGRLGLSTSRLCAIERAARDGEPVALSVERARAWAAALDIDPEEAARRIAGIDPGPGDVEAGT